MSSLLGYSVLNVAPAPHFQDNDISQYIGKKVFYYILLLIKVMGHADGYFASISCSMMPA